MTDPAVHEQAAVLEDADDVVAATADELVEDELLVEDVSIDGMCGVY
jgi:mycofactocin precursor